jgi:hypothetical protein
MKFLEELRDHGLRARANDFVVLQIHPCGHEIRGSLIAIFKEPGRFGKGFVKGLSVQEDPFRHPCVPGRDSPSGPTTVHVDDFTKILRRAKGRNWMAVR